MKLKGIFRKESLPFLFRHLLTYLVIVVMAFSISSYAYLAAHNLLTEQSKQNNLKIVSSISELIEERLATIDTLIYNVATHYQTNLILNMEDPLGNHRMYKLREYINLLRSFTYPNDLVEYIVVYAQRNGYVFNDLSARLFDDYHRVLYGTNGFSKEAWHAMLTGYTSAALQPQQRIMIQGAEHLVIPYVQSLPMGSLRQRLGGICVYLNCDELISGFVDGGNFDCCYLMDRQGKLITQFKSEAVTPVELPADTTGYFVTQIDGVQKSVTYYTSPSGFTFVAIANYAVDISSIAHLRTIFLAALSAGVIACLLLALIFSWRTGKPLWMISRVLVENNHLPEADFAAPGKLYEHVSNLVQDNAELRLTLQTQQQELQTSYLMRLLTATYETDTELLTYSHYLGLKNHGVCYSVVNLQIISSSELPQEAGFPQLYFHKAIIRHYLEGSEQKIFVVDTGIDQLTLILQTPSELCETYCSRVEAMVMNLDSLLQEHHANVFAGASLLRRSITQLYHSYREATIAVSQHSFHSAAHVNWFNQPLSAKQLYFFPADIQQRLSACVRSGDSRSLDKLMEEIQQENFVKRTLAATMVDMLLRELQSTLLKTSYEVFAEDPEQREAFNSQLLHLHRASTAKASIHQIHRLFGEICQYADSRKTSHNVEKKDAILTFVRENCYQEALSLSMVAEKFKLCDSYLSTFFKEQTGENYVSFVERLRMERACELLQDGTYTIDDISRTVGYSNAQTFRRAFKRRFGTTPTQFGKVPH